MAPRRWRAGAGGHEVEQPGNPEAHGNQAARRITQRRPRHARNPGQGLARVGAARVHRNRAADRSLGSCVAFIAAAHDPQDPRWASSTTSPCTSPTWCGPASPPSTCARASRTEVSQDELRRYWSVISPASYLDRLKGGDLQAC